MEEYIKYETQRRELHKMWYNDLQNIHLVRGHILTILVIIYKFWEHLQAIRYALHCLEIFCLLRSQFQTLR